MDRNQWIESQKVRLRHNVTIEGPFCCWISKMGGHKKQYPTMTVKFPWADTKKTVNAHRFSYMLYNDVFELEPNMHVSHLCHQTHCVNPEHLSYEPQFVNKSRQICRSIYPTECKTHAPFQDCLLEIGKKIKMN